MKNKLTLTGANVLYFIVAIALLGYQFIASFIFGEAFAKNLYTVVIINQVLIGSFPVLYCVINRIDIREAFRIRKLEPAPALVIVLTAVPLYLGALMFNTIVMYVLQTVAEVPGQNLPALETPLDLTVGILVIAVMPGICEELLHRGLLLTAYEKRGSYRAVVLVAVMFGLFHFDITNLAGPVLLGLVFGYYVVRTGSIFAGILAHFLNNLIAELIQYLWADQPASETLMLTGQDVLAMGIPSIAVAVALLYLFRRITEGRTEIIPPIAGPGEDLRAIVSHWPVAAVLAIYVVLTAMSLFAMMAVKSLY